MCKKDETVDDDAEGDIADSPLLSALYKDITRVEKHVDHQLLVVLVLLVPSAYLYEYSHFKSGWLDAVCVVLVFGAIVIALLRNISKKRRIAEKYGLVCRACGHAPRTHMLLSAATTQRCARCGARLRLDRTG